MHYNKIFLNNGKEFYNKLKIFANNWLILAKNSLILHQSSDSSEHINKTFPEISENDCEDSIHEPVKVIK